MKYTNLGQSGLRVSRICVGCMSYGDRRGRYKWCVEEAEALPILAACYDSGMNFFDTANGYSNGVSEARLSKSTIGDARTSLLRRNYGRLLDLGEMMGPLTIHC